VVGYLGDGINDAPALREADVGISVDTAVDVAKQTAGIVLLNKELAVIQDGVRLGRTTFANTLKYIAVTTSANFGNVLSMAIAAAVLPFLPLLPRQILLLNFLSDIPAMATSRDRVDPEVVVRPQRWDIASIRNSMLLYGTISSVFDLISFATLRVAFSAGPERFHSAWFVVSMWTELVALLMLRTRLPFFRSRPSPSLLIASGIVALITLAIPYSPLAHPLGLEPIPMSLLMALLVIVAGYILSTELAKAARHRRAGLGESG
jgi:P-type Mg2+ transporter